MRKLSKTPQPEVLRLHADTWSAEYQSDKDCNDKKFRYRNPEIKEALCKETSSKCIYCESKIGHNTPGDVEHLAPSSKAPERHFDWANLSIACNECNRRKSAYYDKELPFLDPYTDDVEKMLEHHGVLVSWRLGNDRAEATIRTLELHTLDRRELLQQKYNTLEKARDILALINSTNGILRKLRENELKRMQDVSSEYSAMVRSFIQSARRSSK